VEALGLILKGLTDEDFKGEVRVNYGPNGPKHAHVDLFLELEGDDLPAKLRAIGARFQRAAQLMEQLT
jgi:hypothetical protein